MWAGVIPLQDSKEAIKELHRSRELGSKALNVKATPIPGKEWTDPHFDPIFDELEKTNTPIIFHDTKTGSMGHERFANNFFFSHMVGRTIESMVCLMVYLCGGIMEKHPDLKIICLETGASQMPWWLSRMDEHFEKLPHLVPWQKRKPSDIFNESVYVGCEPFEDGLFEWAVEYLGGDRLGARHRLAALGFVAAGTGDRPGGQEHQNLTGEQKKSFRRERDQSARAWFMIAANSISIAIHLLSVAKTEQHNADQRRFANLGGQMAVSRVSSYRDAQYLRFSTACRRRLRAAQNCSRLRGDECSGGGVVDRP